MSLVFSLFFFAFSLSQAQSITWVPAPEQCFGLNEQKANSADECKAACEKDAACEIYQRGHAQCWMGATDDCTGSTDVWEIGERKIHQCSWSQGAKVGWTLQFLRRPGMPIPHSDGWWTCQYQNMQNCPNKKQCCCDKCYQYVSSGLDAVCLPNWKVWAESDMEAAVGDSSDDAMAYLRQMIAAEMANPTKPALDQLLLKIAEQKGWTEKPADALDQLTQAVYDEYSPTLKQYMAEKGITDEKEALESAFAQMEDENSAAQGQEMLPEAHPSFAQDKEAAVGVAEDEEAAVGGGTIEWVPAPEQCWGLNQQKDANSADECKAACEKDTACEIYQWGHAQCWMGATDDCTGSTDVWEIGERKIHQCSWSQGAKVGWTLQFLRRPGMPIPHSDGWWTCQYQNMQNCPNKKQCCCDKCYQYVSSGLDAVCLPNWKVWAESETEAAVGDSGDDAMAYP